MFAFFLVPTRTFTKMRQFSFIPDHSYPHRSHPELNNNFACCSEAPDMKQICIQVTRTLTLDLLSICKSIQPMKTEGS